MTYTTTSVFFIMIWMYFSLTDCKAQFDQSTTSGKEALLILANKKNTSRKNSIKSGDRVKILTKDKMEKKGKIIRMDSFQIYLKKEKIAIEEIYSIARRPNPATEFLGGIMGGAGIILLLGSLSPFSSIASDEIRNEALITGGLLTATSVILLYRKPYNHKKWIFEVINN